MLIITSSGVPNDWHQRRKKKPGEEPKDDDAAWNAAVEKFKNNEQSRMKRINRQFNEKMRQENPVSS